MNVLTRIGFATVGLASMLTVSPAAAAGTGYSYPHQTDGEEATPPPDVPTAGTIGPKPSSSERHGSPAPIAPADRYGSPAGDTSYDREIRLGPGTRSVSVARKRGREVRRRERSRIQVEVRYL